MPMHQAGSCYHYGYGPAWDRCSSSRTSAIVTKAGSVADAGTGIIRGFDVEMDEPRTWHG